MCCFFVCLFFWVFWISLYTGYFLQCDNYLCTCLFWQMHVQPHTSIHQVKYWRISILKGLRKKKQIKIQYSLFKITDLWEKILTSFQPYQCQSSKELICELSLSAKPAKMQFTYLNPFAPRPNCFHHWTAWKSPIHFLLSHPYQQWSNQRWSALSENAHSVQKVNQVSPSMTHPFPSTVRWQVFVAEETLQHNACMQILGVRRYVERSILSHVNMTVSSQGGFPWANNGQPLWNKILHCTFRYIL